MIAVVRITGDVNLKKEIKETLNRLKLRKKYSCIILEENEINKGMVKKVKDFVAYGKISEETKKKMNEKRKTKIKNFYRLHPPRKGIEAKRHFGVGKGVLGDNKEKINNLIERML
jgi:large subunit ribosomal protein L30